jgi:serine/threonine protein kinase
MRSWSAARPYATWDVPNGAYLAIASDVAKGMSFIHYHGLLHRDLKPGNVRTRHSDSRRFPSLPECAH